jgi:hypothetical protein
MRSPDTGLSEVVYAETEVQEIQKAKAAAGAAPAEPGTSFVSREDLMRDLDLGRAAVLSYEASGLLHRRTTPGRRGHAKIWYPRAECDQLRTLLAERKDQRYEDKHGPCLITCAVIQQYGWSWNTLRRWERACPWLAGGRLVPVWYSRKLGAGKPRRAYRICDLKAIQEARARGFPGYYDTPEGRRLDLKTAAVQSGLNARRLRGYTRLCPLLPEGRLRSVRVRLPNAQGSRAAHTILEADLCKLTDALRSLVRDGDQEHEWQSVKAICHRYKVTHHRTRIHVHRLLRAAHANGTLSGIEITKQYTNGCGTIRKSWHFNVQELDRLLAGRSLADVATEFAQAAAHGEPAAAVVAGIRDRAKRGRKPDPRAQAINELCFVEYVNNDKSRSVVMRIVNKQYPGAILNAKDVKVRADRWAQRNGIQITTKKPTKGEGTK